MSAVTVYVPRDVAALAAGADRVAQRIAAEAAARGVELRLVRNGSRGLLWLSVEAGGATGRLCVLVLVLPAASVTVSVTV